MLFHTFVSFIRSNLIETPFPHRMEELVPRHTDSENDSSHGKDIRGYRTIGIAAGYVFLDSSLSSDIKFFIFGPLARVLWPPKSYLMDLQYPN